MTEAVWFFFSVGGVIVLLLAVALWLYVRPYSKAARRSLVAIAVFYGLISLYGVSYGAGRLLANGFEPLEPADVPPGRTAIVVLGSWTYTTEDWNRQRYSIADRPSANRVREAFRVFNAVQAEWIISSAGLIDEDETSEPNGLTMRNDLVQLGVPPSQILVETRSRNTHEEAVMVADMLRSMPVDHVVLVTTDIHMRRAVGAFRSEGVEVIPAIAPHVIHDTPWYIPTDDGLHEAAAVAHEVIGLGYYIVRGWYRR